MGFKTENYIKTPQEIDTMRKAGKILSAAMANLRAMVRPGLDVWDLEEEFTNFCQSNRVIPACKGYNPFNSLAFPTGLCVSINSQSVHCFPKKGTTLKEGDVITVDTVIKTNGIHVDSAFACVVGNATPKVQKLVSASEAALINAIEEVSDGVKIGKISNKMETTLKKAGFNVLKDYAGHGIGKEMHEWPQILCYGDKNEGPKLKSGMTICIESLSCSGNHEVENVNLWETKMKDNGLFAQFEHTVLVLDKGYEILTK